MRDTKVIILLLISILSIYVYIHRDDILTDELLSLLTIRDGETIVTSDLIFGVDTYDQYQELAIKDDGGEYIPIGIAVMDMEWKIINVRNGAAQIQSTATPQQVYWVSKTDLMNAAK